MRVGSLFSGIGGFELAAEWMGWTTAWQSEIDPYCTALLAERFPGVPNLGDISTIDWSQVERPDIITGGFPCQDISYAGKGAGLAGKRSGLWYEYARAIREVGPRYVIVENVRALLTRGFGDVLGTLADLGYDAEWAMYGAADVGAPHRRHRVWILAYANGWGFSRGAQFDQRATAGKPAQQRDNALRLRAPLADTDQQGPQGRHSGELPERPGELAAWSGRASPTEAGWWLVEPNVGRVAHGVSARVDRLRGLGNAIVPACALPIFRRIEELEAGLTMREAA